jgi:hypothetical protein
MIDWDGCRWDGRSGHYESWFQRANHPTRPIAFWIRHTIFCPKGKPEAAEGEIWSVWFDAEKGKPIAAKTEIPRRDCSFDLKGLDVKMPGAQLKPGALAGGTGKLKWNLTWANGGPTSLLLPESLYAGGFPKAKALCSAPNARFSGTYEVDGESHVIDAWPGSHNHNWGSQHTDRYAWAQVCGFDDAPDVFLECGTAQVKVGPIMTPKVTVAVLNLEGRRLELNGLARGAMARAAVDGFGWTFSTSADGVELDVALDAPPERFVALRYRNPPAGAKACLNSKIARCTLTVREEGHSRTFTSANRAAFEILCEEADPRVAQVGGIQV